MINEKAPGSFFNSLQVFRGLAALMVVFHHEWIAFIYFYNVENSIVSFIAALGKYGVDFFFVLSGFIITYSNYKKAGLFIEQKSYILNRILRIYLPFLPISIIMLMLYYLFPSASEGNSRDISILTSLTLIPSGSPALTVAWTLVHEMMFYLLFLSWFISKRLWYGIIGIWTFIIIYLNYFTVGLNWTDFAFFKYFGSFYNLEFIFGFLSALFVRQKIVYNNRIFQIFGALLLIAFIYIKWISRTEMIQSSIMNLLIALSFSFIIIGFLNSGLDKIRSRNIFMILGNASYSIYLVHNLGISIMVRGFLKFPSLPVSVAFLTIFVICCIIGVIYSKVFEEYLLKILKSKLIKKKVVLIPVFVPK